MDRLAIVILAAGLGKRLGSETPKAAVSTAERPIIQHLLRTVSRLEAEKIVIVTGHRRELVEEAVRRGAKEGLYPLAPISFAEQKQQLGTGDAVRSAESEFSGFLGNILILLGDTPLTSRKTLQSVLDTHERERATVTLLTLKTLESTSYGRIVRDAKGAIIKNVEVKDCSPAELLIDEHNSGVYCVDSAFLWPAVRELKNENSQKEYYLTDILERASKEGQTIAGVSTTNADEIQGVNTRTDLARINQSLMKTNVMNLIEQGVVVTDPAALYVDAAVKIGPGAKIGPNVQIRGNSVIEADVEIEGNALIINSHISKGAHIKLGVRIEDSKIGTGASVGPFANLRSGTVLDSQVKVGNFVETKKAHLKSDAKASHLTYLGDCVVGEHSNIGAGTITCNYDGVNKHQTTIGKNVFIGSDSCLVAPVEIEDGAYVGAGSVITKKVERDSLAVARAQQISKPGWAAKKREKDKKK